MDKSRFLELCTPVAELVEAKGSDYQNKITLEQYFPFEDKSYIHMLNTKVLRLISLASKQGAPTFESTKDSVYDLMAYAGFYLEFLEKQDRTHPKRIPPTEIAAPGLNKAWRDVNHE